MVMATRRSLLALAQSRSVARQIEHVHPDMRIEELLVVTTGDRIQDRSLTEIGGKGLFVKEIEEALLAGQARFAVHSVKDLPAELAPGLAVACIPRREDPRDVFLSRSGRTLLDLEPGARVGTSSQRRRLMLAQVRPDLRFELLRGNVDTRIRKVREGVVDATVLARAGLIRLGMQEVATETLGVDVMLPAVGQGALGIECREDDHEARELLSVLHDPETAVAVAVERGVMVGVGGSCRVPLAAYACRESGGLWLRAMLGALDGERSAWKTWRGDWPDSESRGLALGLEVGSALLMALQSTHQSR